MSKYLELILHPSEMRAVAQWYGLSLPLFNNLAISDILKYYYRAIWHDPVFPRDPEKESDNLKRCYELLKLTSRSFAAVIEELSPELREAVRRHRLFFESNDWILVQLILLLLQIVIFYLILRGLDTIEDDMTIPNPVKLPILRSFQEVLDEPGWQYHDSRFISLAIVCIILTLKIGKEKDAVVLEEFDKIITEYQNLKSPYKAIIKDITEVMGNGMASYCEDEDFNKKGVDTVKDYNLYCHYVAGIIGEGLTRLGVAAELSNPKLMDNPQL